MEKTIKLTNSNGDVTEMQLERYKAILNSRKLVQSEGKFNLVARQQNDWTDEEDRKRTIVNFQAVTPWHVERAKALIKEGKYQEALNQNITATVFYNEDGTPSTYLPAEGEMVKVLVHKIINKQGDPMLAVQSILEISTSETGAVSFDDFFADSDGDEFKDLKEEAKKLESK
jgi:hypothetical protein